MATPIDRRSERLRERRRDPYTGRVMLREASRHDGTIGSGRPIDPVVDYMLQSACEVGAEYTAKTYEECDRVQNQVGKALGERSIHVDFSHQGSVTNNTHIRLHSDIDLLVVPTTFHHLKAPLVVTQRYAGNAIDELVTIRRICEESLAEEYPAASVNTQGSKAVSISGGSLMRKVDVVAASWVHTQEYERTKELMHKGINVLDKNNLELIENFPFLHNAWINHRDRETRGNLRRLIRLVKSIRADSNEDIDVSSYHIAGLCFAMPAEQFSDDIQRTLSNFISFAWDLVQNQVKRDALWVPNRTEKLFANIRLPQLTLLISEALDLVRAKAA